MACTDWPNPQVRTLRDRTVSVSIKLSLTLRCTHRDGPTPGTFETQTSTCAPHCRALARGKRELSFAGGAPDCSMWPCLGAASQTALFELCVCTPKAERIPARSPPPPSLSGSVDSFAEREMKKPKGTSQTANIRKQRTCVDEW